MSQGHFHDDYYNEDDLASSVDDQLSLDKHLIPKRNQIRRKRCHVSCYMISTPWLVASTTLNCILIVLAAMGWFAYRKAPQVNDESCQSLFSAYSPLLEGVKYEWYSFPNQLGAASPYRGQPDEELERKWADLARPIILSFPPDHLFHINKSITLNLKPWMPVRQIASGGKGNGLYAQPEFSHQLHCLNLVRKYTYREDWDYTGEQEWADGPEKLRSHVDHCLETLRMALMCTADLTPILISMDPTSPLGGYPDFETVHRCRNIDNLLEWADSEGLLFQLIDRTVQLNSTLL